MMCKSLHYSSFGYISCLSTLVNLYIQYEIFQLFLQQLLNLGLVKNPRQYTREKGCLKKVQCLGSIAVFDEVPVLNCGRKHNPVLASEMDPFGSVFLHLSG